MPSNSVKGLKSIASQIEKCQPLHKLRRLEFLGLDGQNRFSSNTFRQLLNNSKQSLEAIALEYSKDLMREETRILIEEIGMSSLKKL